MNKVQRTRMPTLRMACIYTHIGITSGDIASQTATNQDGRYSTVCVFDSCRTGSWT